MTNIDRVFPHPLTPAPWNPRCLLPQPWADDTLPPDERGAFSIVVCDTPEVAAAIADAVNYVRDAP